MALTPLSNPIDEDEEQYSTCRVVPSVTGSERGDQQKWSRETEECNNFAFNAIPGTKEEEEEDDYQYQRSEIQSILTSLTELCHHRHHRGTSANLDKLKEWERRGKCLHLKEEPSDDNWIIICKFDCQDVVVHLSGLLLWCLLW